VPKTHLTDLVVRKLKAPHEGQITYWDTTPGAVGFGVRVSQGGRKSFVLMRGRQRRRHTIGSYPEWKLAAARREAERLAGELRFRSTGAVLPFEDALELFVSTHCNGLRSGREYERLLRKHFLPALGRRSLDRIRTEDITTVLDDMGETPVLANNAFARVRTLFRWATRRRYIAYSPCEGLQLPSRLAPRARVLSDDELRTILGRPETYPFSLIVRLLILTGQRRSEIGGLRWEYIDEQARTITLPASLTKNKRHHTFPCGDMCIEVLSRVPRQASPYLFPARGSAGTAYCGWSKGKAAFDKGCTIASWTLHDIRRTVATNLAAVGTPPHVTERLLNHVSGTVSGVAAIYNRHAYLNEMREALAAWETKLLSLCSS
jgi:integrase